MATALLQKAFTSTIANQRGIPGVLCCWPLGPVLQFFYRTHAMIGRNVTNHSLVKEAPCLD